jgi:MYXO-CTERM domain-containing protein
MSIKTATTLVLCAAAGVANADIRITEWMYSGTGPEFVEFTNVGNTAVDMTNWSYDDDSRLVGEFDLSGFGVVAAGESVVITEGDAADFRFVWNLDAAVKVLGGYTNNLSRNDEINLFDGTGTLADRLAYGDQNFPGTIRTQGASGNPLAGALGANDPSLWVLSFAGDAYGSYASIDGDLGNPGRYIPAPGAAALLGLGGLVVGRRRR